MTGEQSSLPQIPDSWAWSKIGKISEIVTGNTPSKKIPENYGEYIPFVKPPQLNNNVVTEADDHLSKKGAKIARILPPKSILVSCIGILGKTGINKIPVAFNQQINAIILPKYVNPEFGFYYFQTAYMKIWLKRIASATTIPIVNKSKFSRAPFPIAPLLEQGRIVAKLEALFARLDAGLKSLRKVKAQLQSHRQAVLKHAFGGKLTEEWRKTHIDAIEPALRLLERIKEERKKKTKGKYRDLPPLDTSGLPELPESWTWARIGGSVFLSSEKFDPMISGNRRFVGLKHIESNKGRLLGFGKSLETRSTKNVFRKGDLLYGKLRPYLNKVWVSDFNGVCSTDILVFLKNDFVDSRYLSTILLNTDFVNYSTQRMKGVQHPRISFQTLSKYVFPLPSLYEQKVIGEEIERRFSIITEIGKVTDQALMQAERMRQSILKKAFEGRLVPHDLTDEPAEKLLERIRENKEKFRSEEKRKNRTKSKRRGKRKQSELVHYVQ